MSILKQKNISKEEKEGWEFLAWEAELFPKVMKAFNEQLLIFDKLSKNDKN